MSGRIDARFAALRAAGRAGLVTFLTAGDPDFATSCALLAGLPEAGADLIEIGMPFTDPMADGPSIQAASVRALAGGARMTRTLELVRRIRARDGAVPIILMGYYNPIYAYGGERFLADAKAAGADGLIVVDLPPEEDAELCLPARAAGLDFIRLATPTTDDRRLPAPGRGPDGHHRSTLERHRRRSCAQATSRPRQRRLRHLLEIPPRPRTTTSPPISLRQ